MIKYISIFILCIVPCIFYAQNTYIVTSVNDPVNPASTVSGELRYAIDQANAHPGHDNISFNITGTYSSPISIDLYSSITISDEITIDGNTQSLSGYTGTAPKITLIANPATFSGNNLFYLPNGSDNSVIKNLTFDWRSQYSYAIYIYQANTVTLQGNLFSGAGGFLFLHESNSNIIKANDFSVITDYASCILVIDANSNQIGGSVSGDGNNFHSPILVNYPYIKIYGMNGSADFNKITSNVFSKSSKNIDILNITPPVLPGNQGKSAPTISTSYNGYNTIVTGTSAPNDYIEIYISNSTGQDAINLLTTTTADASGNYVATISGLNISGLQAIYNHNSGIFISATATDISGNTSEFIATEIQVSNCCGPAVAGLTPLFSSSIGAYGEAQSVFCQQQPVEFNFSYNTRVDDPFFGNTTACQIDPLSTITINYGDGTQETHLVSNPTFSHIYTSGKTSPLYYTVTLPGTCYYSWNPKDIFIIDCCCSITGVVDENSPIKDAVINLADLNNIPLSGNTLNADFVVCNSDVIYYSNFSTTVTFDYGDGTSEVKIIDQNTDLLNINHTYPSSSPQNVTYIIDPAYPGCPNVTGGFTSGTPGPCTTGQISYREGNCVDALVNLSVLDCFNPSASYSWAFGDGTFGTGLQVSHAYHGTGNYIITVTISQPGVADIVITKPIVIKACTKVECKDCIGSFQPDPGNYILSAWVREDVTTIPKTYNNPKIKVSFTGVPGPGTLYGTDGTKNKIIEGWQRIEEVIAIPASALDINLELVNLSTSDDVYFDDIRILPVDGQMKTYVYDPVTLRLSATLDENNYATFYEYDEEGKLIRVKKETEKGIMTVQESRESSKKK